MLAHHPGLVRLDRAGAESGEDQKRQAGLKNAYTGIWWYAGQPNHYRGDGSAGNAEFGQALFEAETAALVEMIRSVKKDTVTAELQKKFFDDAAKPLETKPSVKK
jgi:creatinine amidohydrolase